jgi:7-carboxy-7-deazaguanine synthase (Cx14CxxC type)
MTYYVKEIFYTLQGEGAQSGRVAVFCRFAGCNLWSGREEDRDTAVCQFCDTDFILRKNEDEGKYANAKDLATKIDSYWPSNILGGQKFVVCTGGEPLLQLDHALIAALKDYGFQIAVETNGTILAPQGIDWICVSPKEGAELVQQKGDEIKIVFPQLGLDPASFEELDFSYYFLQAMDSCNAKNDLQETIKYCLEHPKWRLSMQTHKTIGIR